MTVGQKEVFWGGLLIGRIQRPSFDHLNFYGTWEVIADRDLYLRFLEEVAEDEGALVNIGGPGSALVGRVQEPPGEDIEIKLHF